MKPFPGVDVPVVQTGLMNQTWYEYLQQNKSITAGNGITGGSSTGTIAVSLSTITNSLGADVLLNNTATFFDGPSIAQGTVGTWFASGTVTMSDTGAANMLAKLWDGTTVIASSVEFCAAAGFVSISLSGFIVSPVANIRISVRDITTANGKILFNASGVSKDSTISGIRIA
jgi:hypothetical protein